MRWAPRILDQASGASKHLFTQAQKKRAGAPIRDPGPGFLSEGWLRCN